MKKFLLGAALILGTACNIVSPAEAGNSVRVKGPQATGGTGGGLQYPQCPASTCDGGDADIVIWDDTLECYDCIECADEEILAFNTATDTWECIGGFGDPLASTCLDDTTGDIYVADDFEVADEAHVGDVLAINTCDTQKTFQSDLGNTATKDVSLITNASFTGVQGVGSETVQTAVFEAHSSGVDEVNEIVMARYYDIGAGDLATLYGYDAGSIWGYVWDGTDLVRQSGIAFDLSNDDGHAGIMTPSDGHGGINFRHHDGVDSAYAISAVANPDLDWDYFGNLYMNAGWLGWGATAAASATCIIDDAADRLFADIDCDNTKDAEEDFLDLWFLEAADGTGATSAFSGFELAATAYNELALLQGCADAEVLVWDEANSWWECAAGGVNAAGDLVIGNGNKFVGGGIDGNGVTGLGIGSVDITDVTFVTDATGDGEIVFPDDVIGPDEVLAAGQVDDYLLAYEATGDTWKWTDPATLGGGGGDVTGPGASTDEAIVRFNGATGKIIQDYSSLGPTVGDNGILTMNNGIKFGSTLTISNDTLDPTDTQSIIIAGGGTNSTTRGAWMILEGNEAGVGSAQIRAGDSGGTITLLTSTADALISLTSEQGATDDIFSVEATGFLFTGNAGDDVSIGTGLDFLIAGDTSGTMELIATAVAGTNVATFKAETGTVAYLADIGASGDVVKHYNFTAGGLDTAYAVSAERLILSDTIVVTRVLAFDDTTEEFTNGEFIIPTAYSATGGDTVTFRATWIAATHHATNINVEWTFSHTSITADGDFDTAFTTEVSADCPHLSAQDDVIQCEWTETVTNLNASGWAAEDIVFFKLSRTEPSANELAGDAYLVAFDVEIPLD